MRKAFTINCMRTQEDFDGYSILLEKNIYQAIEIFYPYNVSEEQKKLYTENLLKIRKKYPEIEVVLHLPHGANNSLTNERLLDSFQLMIDSIDYANQFDTKKLTLHLGSVNSKIPRERYVKNIIPVLQKLCEYAGKYNMNIMIENMPSLSELGVSPDEILEIIQRTNRKNLKFILDTGHAFVSKYPLTDFVYKLKEYLYHLHFNDCDGTKDEHKRMHLGKINFEELFVALNEIRYNELHCMEVIFKNYLELIDFSLDLEIYEKYYER